MTNVIIITNKNDLTADFVVKKLWDRGIEFYRLNTEAICRETIPEFDFEKRRFELFDSISGRTIDLSRISGVYFRRPELPIIDDTAISQGERIFIHKEYHALLDGLYRILDPCFWVSRVECIRQAENKIYQLLLSQKLGFAIPPSVVTSDPVVAKSFLASHGEVIVKPLKSGLIQDTPRERVVFTSKIQELDSSRIPGHPNYFQKQINKRCDLRITVVGNKLFPAEIHSQDVEDSIIDWRKGSEHVKYGKHILPTEIESKCLDLVRALGLEFAAIDMILDREGNYYFLEINPNGQWAWLEKSLDFDISGAIVDLMCRSYQ